MGGTCGSVHAQTFNNNLKELGVVESKRNTVLKGLVHELLNAQDTVLCSYFAQRSGERGEGRSRKSTEEEAFQGLDSFLMRFGEEQWGGKWAGRLRAEITRERVDVGMLEQEGKSRAWQP